MPRRLIAIVGGGTGKKNMLLLSTGKRPAMRVDVVTSVEMFEQAFAEMTTDSPKSSETARTALRVSNLPRTSGKTKLLSFGGNAAFYVFTAAALRMNGTPDLRVPGPASFYAFSEARIPFGMQVCGMGLVDQAGIDPTTPANGLVGGIDQRGARIHVVRSKADARRTAGPFRPLTSAAMWGLGTHAIEASVLPEDGAPDMTTIMGSSAECLIRTMMQDG